MKINWTAVIWIIILALLCAALWFAMRSAV